jgi:hypothetical protein
VANNRQQGKAWTAVGAARSAREARIATVRHLRTAPIARAWQMSRLANAYRTQLAHVGDPAAVGVLLFGGMGYRPPYPTDLETASEMVVADEARYLAEADLYVLTPEMCAVAVAAAQALTLQDLELVGDDDLPGMTGLVFLPQPVIVKGMTGDLGDDRAYTWRYPSQIQRPAGRGRRLRDTPAIRMSAYCDTYGPVRPDSFAATAAQARAQGNPLPPLLFDSVRCLPLHYTSTPGQVHDLEKYAATVRKAGDETRELAAEHGLDEGRVVGEYRLGQRIEDPNDTFMVRFLYAFWRLCEQRIATVEHAGVNHSAQAVAERAGVSPDVRVVRLRRTESQANADHGGREWHHRWVVRMHKVRQWYPSSQQHKVIYRGPYIKGPEDKPLLDGEIVRGLVR